MRTRSPLPISLIGSAMLLAAAILAGCASNKIPEDALRLPESTLDVRSIQTRTLEAPSDIDILVAAIAVLQDMDFNVDRVEKPLGIITASKVADADSTIEKTGLIFLDLLCVVGGSGTCSAYSTAQDDQRITLTLVVLPSLKQSGVYSARITIQRVIFDKADRIKALERIDDPAIYQQIFVNLRKSLFLQVAEE